MTDRKSQHELLVITKTYDLILWSCNHTGKFPRNHRFVLGERIERNLYDLLEVLIRAKIAGVRPAGRKQLSITKHSKERVAGTGLLYPEGVGFYSPGSRSAPWGRGGVGRF